MKKFLLISAALFVPVLGYASFEPQEKVLPLDYDEMEKTYITYVGDEEKKYNVTDCEADFGLLLSKFFAVLEPVPFSANDLLSRCVQVGKQKSKKPTEDYVNTCKSACSKFTMNYMRNVATKLESEPKQEPVLEGVVEELELENPRITD